jgi:hypothetical protein
MPEEGFYRAGRTRPGPSIHGPEERRRRAEHACGLFTRLALASAKAHRGKRSGGAAA